MNEEYILKIVLEDKEFIVSVNGVEKRVGSLKQAFDEGKKGAKGLSDETAGLTKKNIDLTSNAGLAGATLTEFGRTISDLPYGIRGVANNLSQLSTLFITLVAKSADGGRSIDGVRSAFGLLVKQLKGPLGFILAFQAVIALLDFFSGKSKKAAEAADTFTDAADRQSLTLQVLLNNLQDTNLSLETRQSLLDAASLSTSKLTKILEDANLTEAERKDRAEEFLRIELDRIQKLSLVKEREEAVAEARLANAEAVKAQEKAQADLDAARGLGIRAQGSTVKLQKELNEAQEAATKTTAALDGAEKSLTSTLLAVSEATKLQNQLLKSNTKSKGDNKDATEDLIAITFKDFLAAQQEGTATELANIELVKQQTISSLKAQGLSFDEFQKKKEFVLRMATNAEIGLLQKILDTNQVGATERIQIETRIAELTGELLDSTEERIRDTSLTRKEQFEKDLQEIAGFLSSIENIANMFSDAELQREERKTTILNNELRDRLRNENLSKDERIRINKQIEANELKLQKKRDEIAERNFKLQKAFAIAQAAINTALAISGVLAQQPGGLISRKVAAVIIGALGAAQIAAIASQKFVPTATSVPGGVGAVGAGASTSQAQDPAFNIVGTGQQFQLAQVIAQRTGEPVRAFVVSGDVRTGLALDRNIINSSKIN